MRTRRPTRSPAWSTTSTTSAIPTSRPAIRATRSRRLADAGYPQEVIDAVAGHADFMGVPRETRMAKTLYAVDELSGFIAACALVRPTGIEGMKPKSVKKKLKQPSFAAAVNRDEVQRGIEELAVDQDEHIALIIEALAERAAELGLEPQEGSGADCRELERRCRAGSRSPSGSSLG